jgi:hypothetical protein
MDDVIAPVPDVPPYLQEADTHSQIAGGVSSVEYAMVYQAEKPRLVRYLIHCGADWHAADDAAQHALTALYYQWETVRNPRSWLRKVAFREFTRVKDTGPSSLEGHDRLRVPQGPADIESFLEQDADGMKYPDAHWCAERGDAGAQRSPGYALSHRRRRITCSYVAIVRGAGWTLRRACGHRWLLLLARRSSGS